MTQKTTLVLGASAKPNRYSNMAIRSLLLHHHTVIAVGLREDEVEGIKIRKPFPEVQDIHTITLYIGAKHQPGYYFYILGIHPQRVIFNPGTENESFEKALAGRGIEVVRGCTLIMLSDGTY